jgi:hypothetical protein
MFVVVQVRQTLQQAVTIGACSTARLAMGNIRTCARSNTLTVCQSGCHFPRQPRYPGRAMARPPKDDDATKDLKPEDKTQRAKAGTKIGLLRKDEVMAAFRKVARSKR